LRHLEDVAPNGFGLPSFFGVDARISPRRIHEGEHRQLEFLGRLHQAQGLAIALGLAHAEVPHGALFGIATLLVAEHHAGRAVEARQPADDRQVVGKMPVPVQLDEIREDFLDVIERVRPLGMPGNLGDLPRRQVAVDVLGELQALFAELVDFF